MRIDEKLIFRQVKQYQTLSGFLKTLVAMLHSPYPPKFDRVKEVHKLYKEYCEKVGEMAIPTNIFYHILRKYGLETKRLTVYNPLNKDGYRDKPKITHHRGMVLKEVNLKELMSDIERLGENTGTTIIFVGGVPYRVHMTLVPVEDNLLKALTGRQGRKKKDELIKE